MRSRRLPAAAACLLTLTFAACGSGSGTEEDRGVPAGPEDAGTTDGGTGPGENQPLIPPETGGDK